MPEYLAPGVYVEEVDTGAKPIEGVSTSTAAMLGVTERGPVNTPILITSYGDFTRWFGGTLINRDFHDDVSGDHCYLPHAVQGFFKNGGKRVYITRVLDTEGAEYATSNLFDRGTDTSAETLLLRAVDEQTGTAANIPLIYALDVSGLEEDDWIRIGNGSNADYRQVESVDIRDNNTHVSLNLPLSFSHAVGDSVDQFTPAEDGDGFTLVDPVGAGDTTIFVQGEEGVITALQDNVSAASEILLQIGGAYGEYHFVAEVNITASNEARVRLHSPMAMGYAADATAIPIQIDENNIVIENSANLSLAPSAGSSLIFLDDRASAFNDRNSLVLIDNSLNAHHREVRRIGDLSQIHIAGGVYEECSSGTLVEAVNLSDDDRTISNGDGTAIGDLTITVNDAIALMVGQSVIVGANVIASAEEKIIQEVDIDTDTETHQQTHQLTFTTGLEHVHEVDDLIRPLANTITSVASAGSRVIALNNRLGLAVGDVIRIGVIPNDEYVTIDALPGLTGNAPDEGKVILEQRLVHNHAEGTEVRRQAPPEPVGELQSTVLALDAPVGDQVMVVTDGNGYTQNTLIRLTTPTPEVFYHRLAEDAESSLADTPDFIPAEVTLRAPAVNSSHPAGSSIVVREPLITVQALDQGGWGNRLRVVVEDEEIGLVPQTGITGSLNPTTIRLSSLAGVESGTVLELFNPADDSAIGDPVKVRRIDRSEGTATLDAALSPDQADALATQGALNARSREFRLSVFLLRQPDPAMPMRNDSVIDSEVFRHLSMDHRHSRYIHNVIGTTWELVNDNDDDGDPLRLSDRRSDGESWYIRVRDLAQDLTEPQRTEALESVRIGPEDLIDILPDGRERAARMVLARGDDSVEALRDATYIGADNREPANRTGLYTFRIKDDISILACPGRTSAQIQGALINHCENMRYRFAVLDGAPPPGDSLNDIQAQRQRYDSKYAALYHPWLLIPDPYPDNLAKVADYPIPPSGHMLGIYARTDIERGVHKAPANVVVRGITGLQRTLNKGEHDILNPVNINVVRDFRRDNRGIRVWGGRVITSDPDWKYVNVRRLLIFIEASIERGVQWVVFEPNAEPLWARVRRAISNFLTVVWRNGALEGTKPQEAFFVKCDRTTMTQTDIDNGRLICMIGVAPVKPAEFVIIRIGLWTAHAED